MKVGILGAGEVGKALSSFYKEKKIKTFIKDFNKIDKFENIDVLNICIPYTESFISIVCDEIVNSKPQLTIIHSTVPIGTTQIIKNTTKTSVVHSPVVGSHPYLKKSLKTFTKYVGYDDKSSKKLAKKHFNILKLKCNFVKKSKSTETAKLLCTSYYGLCIAWHYYMYNVCKSNKIDFSLMGKWNKDYNLGYKKNKKEKYNRPVLYPPINGKIGGHCVIPNAQMLQKQHPDSIIKEILKFK